MDAQMLEGKVALITGASYGMGRTIAELFAEKELASFLPQGMPSNSTKLWKAFDTKAAMQSELSPMSVQPKTPNGFSKPPLKRSAIWTFS